MHSSQYFSSLFSNKLLIVSGKGGVGKTTVSILLGLMASQMGKKTLLVEMNDAQRIAPYFSKKKSTYIPSSLAHNLDLCSVSPPLAFEEYVLDQIKSKTLFSLVFENKHVRNFLDATPGLSELLQIGKVWSLCEKENNHDLVILDAPATGHGLALLNIAQVVRQAVRIGPLHTQAAKIENLLQDENKCQLIVVTLAEEMPVNECLDMIHQAKEKVNISCGPVILNALYPRVLSNAEWEKSFDEMHSIRQDPLFKALSFYQDRVILQEEYKEKLLTELGTQPCFSLPFLFSESASLDGIIKLSHSLAQNLEGYHRS